MNFTTDKFVTSVITVTVSVIIFSMIALPIINDAIDGLGDDDAQLAMVLSVIPIFIVVGILLSCIYMFIGGKKN